MFDRYFYYDETSPTFLRWKVSIFSGKNLKTCKIKSGDIAGSLKSNGRHSQVQLNGKNYMVHRIIFELFNGKVEENFCIDHIDGNCLNNSIYNLRMVTQTVNMRNQKKPKNNLSGEVGIHYTSYKNCEYWIASWRDLAGKFKQKCFSIKKLGNDCAKEQAILFRKLKIEELNKQGAGYTERHGK